MGHIQKFSEASFSIDFRTDLHYGNLTHHRPHLSQQVKTQLQLTALSISQDPIIRSIL